MKGAVKKIFFLFGILLTLPLSAQEKEPGDSVVRLLSAESLQQVKENGVNYRKAFGRPGNAVTFLHNGTYLICDTAYWNMDSKVIDAFGNVKILQNETALTSDKLVYLVDDNLAQFRGTLVQLIDKDNNILRTRDLDYNTKDSTAIFHNGGSMKDKDGQIIESIDGTYDSKIKFFTFEKEVNMFTDSIFIKTSRLTYDSNRNYATFSRGTDVWKEEDMLSSNDGWYDRNGEEFCFMDDVHVMTATQEGWCDTLYYYRNTQNVTMYGNVQVTDTTRDVSSLSGYLEYLDSLSKVTLLSDPAVVVGLEDEKNGPDTLYFRADTIEYRAIIKCEVDSALVKTAEDRIKSIDVDPVTEFRRKAAEQAAREREEAMKDDPNNPVAAAMKREKKLSTLTAIQPKSDSLSVQSDSLSVQLDSLAMSADSLSNVSDSLANLPAPKDSSDVGFMRAVHNVKVYRDNLQMVCDSLEYCDLDSLCRLYKDPIIWNGGNKQYVSDSVYVLIRDGNMEKANLMSDAFAHIQEDTLHYDQVRGSEMVAYFDPDGSLKRFDSLGSASAIFFIEENDVLATVNRKESKMLSALFKDGEIDRVYYYDTPKSDAYPIVQMPEEEQTLKGFCWQPEKRPGGKEDITERVLRPCQRISYELRPKASFDHTRKYFPGYIDDIHKQIQYRDSIRREREAMEKMMADSLSSAPVADSLERNADSLPRDVHADTLSVKDVAAGLADSTAVSRPDTLASVAAGSSAKEIRLQKKEAREHKREVKWAEKDSKDSMRQAARDAKKAAKLRRNKLKSILDENKRLEKENARLEKYKERYKNKKAGKEKSSGKKKLKKIKNNGELERPLSQVCIRRYSVV